LPLFSMKTISPLLGEQVPRFRSLVSAVYPVSSHVGVIGFPFWFIRALITVREVPELKFAAIAEEVELGIFPGLVEI